MEASSSDSGRPPRRLTDPRAMRALTHPVRLALLEVLTMSGSLTATAAGDLIGETATTCSFHLRQLAHYGFVEEADGGRGRSRPWRLVDLGWRVDQPEGPAAVASDALVEMSLDRMLARHRSARAAARHRADPDLSPGPAGPTGAPEAEMDETVWWVTPAELAELRQEIDSLVLRYRDRLLDPARRPPTALPTEVVVLTHAVTVPAGPPGRGTAGRQDRDGSPS